MSRHWRGAISLLIGVAMCFLAAWQIGRAQYAWALTDVAVALLNFALALGSGDGKPS